MTTFQMLKAICTALEGISDRQAKEFEHLSTALGDIMRDLDEIKSRLDRVRKVRRRAARPSSRT